MSELKTLPKTHWKKLYNPNYMGAWSINQGQEIILTIESVRFEGVKGMKGRSEDCTVIYWKQDQKPFILNKTNAKSITKSIGSPYIEDWAGHNIKLYVDPNVEAFGDIVEALRVRSSKVTLKKESLTPSHPKWSAAQAALFAKNTTIEAIKKNYAISPQDEKLLTNAEVA